MYLVDGYNLLHALKRHAGVLPGNGADARARLIQLVSHLARRESSTARIFFDGTPGEIGAGRLHLPATRVVFCGPERESADQAIRDFVENAPDPRKLRVVSSDHAVVNACRLSGARIVASREMADRLAGLAPAANARAVPDKPAGGAGRVEREMLKEVGDWEEFRRAVEEDLP